MDSTKRRRIFSGIQPSGALHLGNYIGAIRQWVDRQENQAEEVDAFICVVDLHAITVAQDRDEFHDQTRSLFASLIACGIDPEKTGLFVQSHVRAHTEATWMLLCSTPLGWLERMTQFKSKSKSKELRQESIGAGLLTYPVLQAADILLYDADEVPVGEDQKQHVELSRDIAQRFNHLFGETFVVPEPVIPTVGARIMGLDDPTTKMSKSESGARGHAVLLDDSDKEIERALKRAVTDSGREITFSDDPERAGVNNLLTIYSAITGRSGAQTEADFAEARGYGDLKKRVAEVVIETVRPIRERKEQLLSQDSGELDRLMAVGAERARSVAEPKLELMRERIGFLPRP